MNKYRVRIKRNNPIGNANLVEISDAVHLSKREEEECDFMYGEDTEARKGVWFRGEVYYATTHEDLAMSIYSRAKRNIDPKKYMVTLEIPRKEEQ